MKTNNISNIRPISDLKDHFDEIISQVNETQEPLFLSKDGSIDMVVLSMEKFENIQFDFEIYFKLKEAEKYAEKGKTYSTEEVWNRLKAAIE